MVVVNQSGTKTVPFDIYPFEIVPFSNLCDVEPEDKEKFENENLWYAIVAQIDPEDVRIMGGYDTLEKAKKEMKSLFYLCSKGTKIVQLDESDTVENDNFNVNNAIKKIFL